MINFSSKSEYEEIKELLQTGGYSYGTGAQGENGFVRIYHKNSYCLWITFNFNEKKVYLYKEYDCGGMIYEKYFDLTTEILESVDNFSKWWDETISSYLAGYNY